MSISSACLLILQNLPSRSVGTKLDDILKTIVGSLKVKMLPQEDVESECSMPTLLPVSEWGIESVENVILVPKR